MISNTPDVKYLIKQQGILNQNVEFVRGHLHRQMKESLEVGNQLIDEELQGLSILVRPIIKSFYQNLVKKDLERGTRKAIDDLLDLAKYIIENEIEIKSKAFCKLLTQHFPLYLENDQTGRQCKHNHPNFPRLRQNLKNTFKAQVISTVKLLNVAESVENYHELCRLAFPTAKACKNDLKRQTDAMRRGQEIIAEDLSILDIPVGRDLIFRILRKGFDRKIKDFNRGIDQIYATR